MLQNVLLTVLGALLVAGAFVVPALLFPVAMAEVDFITLLRARFKRRSIDIPDVRSEDDFTILVPIFGDIKYLKNVDYLAPYGSRVLLCTTNRESPAFVDGLTDVARLHGFRIFFSELADSVSTKRPNPWGLFNRALTDRSSETVATETIRDEMVREGLTAVQSRFCMFIDGDTITETSVSRMMGVFRDEGYDLASVRVLASKSDTMMEKLQTVEYQLAMDARFVYPWLTSGAGMIARTSEIRRIMRHHSLFFQGGDIEIGKLAGMLGMAVGHLPFVFRTDVPATPRAWFRQRLAWFAGGFRHAVVNSSTYSWRHPFFFFYNTVVVYVMAPVRWYEAVVRPELLLVVIAIYWVLTALFHWRYRSRAFWVFPIYGLIQVLVVIPLGMVNYWRMAHRSHNMGRIKLRPSRRPVGDHGVSDVATAAQAHVLM